MFARKSIKMLSILIAGLLMLLAVAPMQVTPAAGETNNSLRVWSCGPGRGELPIKESIYARPTGAAPTRSTIRQFELELWALSNYNPIMLEIAEEFEGEYGIHITIAFINSGDMHDQLMTAVQGDNLPDLILASSTEIEFLYEASRLTELDPGRLPFFDLLNAAGETCSCDDGFYGFPLIVSNLALFYNKSLFDDAHLDYPDPDWDYDAVLAAAEVFADDDIYGLAVANQAYFYYPIMSGFDGSIFGPPGTSVTLDSPESIAAMDWALQMIAAEYMPPNASVGTVTDMFANGQAAMMFGGAWNLGALPENVEVGITNIPDGGKPLVATDALMIGPTANDYEAHLFIEFVSQYDYMEWISSAIGMPSPLISVLDSSSIEIQNIAYAGANGAKSPYSTVAGTVFAHFNTAVQAAFAGDASAEGALFEAANGIREDLGLE